MSWLDAYERIVNSLPRDPKNEAETRLWVIDRVLREVLGYESVEIVPEESGPGSTRPDYTVLPHSPYCWLLEAKVWSVSLTDQHALQATTYAYQIGKRWVVLSNGKEWRLYDSFMTGVAVADRLVLSATAENPEAMEALFRALRRQTVASGDMEGELARYLLLAGLRSELQREDSACVSAICQLARQQPLLMQTTARDIIEVLQKLLGSDGSGHPGGRLLEPQPPPEAQSEGIPLSGVRDPTGTKPTGVILGGRYVPVKTWKDVWLQIFQYVAENSQQPIRIPWKASTSGQYWVNTQPLQMDAEPMRAPEPREVRGKTYWVETHGSAVQLCNVARAWCGAVGLDPSTIRIMYS